MQKLRYECDKKKLHPDLQNAWYVSKELPEINTILKKRGWILATLRFYIFIILSVFGLKHYDTMGILGYRSLLVDESYVRNNLIKNEKRKKLLDIGAGSGTVTQAFESSVEHIDCIESSPSFVKILQQRGYTTIHKAQKGHYDIVTIFNVLDICDLPVKMLSNALDALAEDGHLIISLPFPICVRSWDNRHIKKTNHIGQSGDLPFEAAVSVFYQDFLKPHGLLVEKFTRLPYIVSLPESVNATIYDNGLFVCRRG